MGFGPPALPSRIADDLSKQGLHACCIRHRTPHSGSSELVFVYADVAGHMMQGTYWEGL